MPPEVVEWARWAIAAVAFTVAIVKGSRWAGKLDSDMKHLHDCIHRVERRVDALDRKVDAVMTGRGGNA